MFDGLAPDAETRAWINALMPAIPPTAWLEAVPRDAAPAKVVEMIKATGLVDGQWHSVAEIGNATNLTSKAVVRTLNAIITKNGVSPKRNYGLACIARKGRPEYRLVLSGKLLEAAEVVKALRPIHEDLQRQGAAHMANWSPATIKMCAGLLGQLLKEWGQ